jgi:hypothetical protein
VLWRRGVAEEVIDDLARPDVPGDVVPGTTPGRSHRDFPVLLGGVEVVPDAEDAGLVVHQIPWRKRSRAFCRPQAWL